MPAELHHNPEARAIQRMSAPGRLDALRTLRVANLDVAFATAFVTLFSGPLLVGFIQMLSQGDKTTQDFWVGLSGAVPALMGLVQVPGAILGRASASFKRYVARGGLWWRLLFLPLVLLPLLPLGNNLKLLILIVCLGSAAFSQNLVNPIYNEWIGKIVPERNRGWYFSQRTLIATITGMVVGLIGAALLDYFKGTPGEPLGFTLTFGLGWACGMLSMYYFMLMGDTARESTTPVSWSGLSDVVKEPFADKNFRYVLLFVAVFMFSQGFAGNLFAAFALESLKMDFKLLQMTAVAAAAGTVMTVKMWGFLTDRYGNKPVLAILAIGVTFTPLLWVFCSPQTPTWNAVLLIGGHVFNGVLWSGVGIAQMNLYLATSPDAKRASYLAAALTISALALAVSPLAGSFMLHSLRAVTDPVTAYKAVFLVVVLVRVFAVVSLAPIREIGAVSFRVALRQLSKIRPAGYMALRTMRRTTDAGLKREAIRGAGVAQIPLATEDLVLALGDPVPRVRREAATALGRIGTPDAAEALVKHALLNPETVEEETLEAMSDTGSSLCVPVLAGFLTDPSAMIRRAAAKGLGKIGDPAAEAALTRAAKEPGDPDLRRAAIQALRLLGVRAEDVYGEALVDQHVSIRVAAAEAVAELEISELADSVRHTIEWFSDDGSAEAAYALGAIGDFSDVQTVMQAAQASVSTAQRRRCLLGAARLYGVEAELYRMFSLDEVSRDTAILQFMRGHHKRDTALAKAMKAYGQDRESEAVRVLGEAEDSIGALVGYDVPESFLLALLAYTGSRSDSGGRFAAKQQT